MKRNFEKWRIGFTLVEIMIVIAIVGIVAALAIPNLLRARVNTNESSVKAALRTFNSGNEMYRGSQNPPVYASAIADLTGGAPPYLDSTWDTADAAPGKHGYAFTYTVAADGSSYSTLAAPIGSNGINTFCVDQSGVIVSGAGGSAPAGDTNGCTGGTPLS